MPSNEIFDEISNFYKILADNSRMKIIWLISEKDICVNEISKNLVITQSAVSHQLRILKQAKLVKCKRQGRNIKYSLADEHVKEMITSVIKYIDKK